MAGLCGEGRATVGCEGDEQLAWRGVGGTPLPRRETPVETRQRFARFLSSFEISPAGCYRSWTCISGADLFFSFPFFLGTMPPRRVCPRAVSALERLASRLARRYSRCEGSGSAPLLFAPTCLIHIDQRSETRVTARRCGIRGGRGCSVGEEGKRGWYGRFIIGKNLTLVPLFCSLYFDVPCSAYLC